MFAGIIEPETSSRNTKFEANAHQLVLRLPGRGYDLGVDREWVVALGLRVVIREVVHELFDSDRVARRQLAVLHDEAPHVAVGRAVDVDREGRQGIGGDGDEGILDDLVILFAVARLALVAPSLGAVESLGWKRVGFGPQVSESGGATNADDAIRRTRPIESSHDDFLQCDRARRDGQIRDRSRVCRDANPLLLA